MNAPIRTVTCTAIYHGLEVYGIRSGYHGMINIQIKKLESHDVRNIIQRGGTILKTARSTEFRTPEGRSQAYANLKKLFKTS